MSLPRPVYPGQTYLATRRCFGRQFRLRPSTMVNQAFWYILGYCASKYRIDLFAALAMSNHTHICARDNEANYPDFLRDFYALLARCLNALHSDFDHFWSNAQPSMVRLGDPESILDKIVYTLTNPVKSALVSRAKLWPGATSLMAMLEGKPLLVRRPNRFFRDEKEGGRMPPTVTITFARPPGLEHLSNDEWRNLLEERIAVVERQCERERAAAGRAVLGVAAVLRESRHAVPKTAASHFGLSPKVAAHDKWRRIDMLQNDKAFRVEHRNARLKCSGGQLATFPAGTWAVHRYFRARVSRLGDTDRCALTSSA